ncbi:MAG: SIMPL domain-containing protein [Actinobacteria bacterium]|nr:SIMPL domain-containing protein [Actinomycetota bacterium]
MEKYIKNDLNFRKMSKLVFFLLIFVILPVIIFGIPGCIGVGPSMEYNPEVVKSGIVRNTIFVNGQGATKVMPDKALVDITTTSENESSEKAMDECSKIAQAVISAIQKTQAENLTTETSSINLEPLYYYVENQPPKIYAYRASLTVKVSTTEITKMGQVIANAVEAGASTLSSIRFDLTDALKEDAQKKALKNALDDARKKAQTIAESMGLRLDKVYYISEIETYYPGPIYAAEETILKSAEAQEVTPPPITPEEMEITANIQVCFTFK